jgi:hypothetical protein
MKRLLLVVGALLFLLNVPVVFAADSVTVNLSSENNSGESGTATLTAMGNQTQVVVKLSGAPATAQPAHIHEGQCGPTLNPVPKFPLADVTNGASTTTVNAKLADLTTGGFAINVHKSAADLTTYVACGNIPTAAASAMAMPSAAPQTGGGFGGTYGQTPWSAVVALVGGVAALGLTLRRRTAR